MKNDEFLEKYYSEIILCFQEQASCFAIMNYTLRNSIGHTIVCVLAGTWIGSNGKNVTHTHTHDQCILKHSCQNPYSSNSTVHMSYVPKIEPLGFSLSHLNARNTTANLTIVSPIYTYSDCKSWITIHQLS